VHIPDLAGIKFGELMDFQALIISMWYYHVICWWNICCQHKVI